MSYMLFIILIRHNIILKAKLIFYFFFLFVLSYIAFQANNMQSEELIESVIIFLPDYNNKSESIIAPDNNANNELKSSIINETESLLRRLSTSQPS